ncbi:hypothetical protein BJ165DRAFT_297033 [Panaeolus papilionaceus]|nr:hypothetical protein BJ165DRAFT_297033 [Panaeolus papilionaceus]
MRGGGWVGDERRRGGSVHVGDSGDGGLEGSRGGGGGGSTVLPLVTLLMPRGAGLGQRLDKTSYDELRVELRRLEWVGVVRFKEVKVDVTGFVNGVGGVREVMRVVGESAVLISTHNPSLINQLWMPSTPRSSIIEIFTPGVYDERYAVLGRNVGHEHYTMWNTTYTADPTALLDGDTLLGEGLGRREDAKPKPQTKEDSKPKEKVDDEPQAPAKPKEKVDEKHIPEPDPKPEVIPQPKPDTNPPPKEPPKASNQDNVDVKASEPPKNTLADSGGVKVSGKAVAQLVRWILTRRMDEEEDVVYR